MNESMSQHEKQPCGSKASGERLHNQDVVTRLSRSALANWTVGAAGMLFPARQAGRMLCQPATSQWWKSRPSRIRTESSQGVNPLYSVSKWYLHFNPSRGKLLLSGKVYSSLIMYSLIFEEWKMKKKSALETGRNGIVICFIHQFSKFRFRLLSHLFFSPLFHCFVVLFCIFFYTK